MRTSAQHGLLGHMRSVKIAEAKDQLSRHLRYVRAGGRVRIYDRDEPVADLVPIEPPSGAGSGWTDEEIADLVRDGLLRPPTQPGPLPREILSGRGPRDVNGAVVAALVAERRGGR